MVRPDLAHIDILGGIYKETPPENVEPDEEDCSIESCSVVSAEERRCECGEEDEGDDAAFDVETGLVSL